MKNDIGKISFDELNHFVGVFHQMGRLPLESDFNEQNELVLRLLERVAGSAMHTGSPNEGFRIGTHVLLDRMDSRRGWAALPATAAVFIDYFDHRVGDGSLVALGATAVGRMLEAPLDCLGLKEVRFAVKCPSIVGLGFHMREGGTSHSFALTEIATDAGWRLIRATPPWAVDAGPQAVTGWGFDGLNPAARTSFDFLEADLPIRRWLVRPASSELFSAAPAGALLAADDDLRLLRSPSLRATAATSVTHTLPAAMDASRSRALLVALRRTPGTATFAVQLQDAAAATLTLAAASVTTVAGWEVHRYTLPQAGVLDWTRIAALVWSGLDPSATYQIGPVLLEVDPALDLLVMGGDGTAAGAGRFFGHGRMASQESHGSYHTQPDLPEADVAALAPVAADERRIDWAYLDLWERPLSYVERPALRDVALEGADTCTRTQLVAQVRLLAGTPVALAATALPPTDAFALLPSTGGGVLSTKDKPAAVLDPCADPCEPAIAGPYIGEENRLFRIEIHAAGDIGPAGAAGTARFKWSRDNAGITCALLAEALASATSAVVEKPELFAIGDLVELVDDRAELVTSVYEDQATHRKHRRGELRKVVTVNLATRRISWDDPTVVDPQQVPFHAVLPESLLLAHHAKLTRWDGVSACTPGDIVLAEGVVVEFGGAGLLAGDYWQFTTRTVDRSVERLIEAPPRGLRHAYYPLAAIHRSRAGAAPEIVFCEDLRPRFAALPTLDASRVAYDPGRCAADSHVAGWDQVSTVQQAIDALCEADLDADLKQHHKLLHGMGVVCGLKLRCARDREQIIMSAGHALDCEGELLHNAGDLAIDIVQRATAEGLLTAGAGKVNLWIEQAPGGPVTRLERHVPKSFWDEVLEGTLLNDFWQQTVMGLAVFFQTQLLPFPDTTLPISDAHRRMISLINLLWQIVNPASGQYLYLSRDEHDLLEDFRDALIAELSRNQVYCAMFDHVQPFPAYPYPVPAGIETMHGLFLLHQKMKLDPSGRYAVTCHGGNRLQVYDTTTRQAVLATDFPGGSNVQVQDLAFNAAGTLMHVVATVSNGSAVDSVFATATLSAGPVPTLTWGAVTVVCDIRFVTLATHASHPNTLFAIGRSSGNAALRGLYRLDPLALPLAPTPAAVFNATGLFAIDSDGARAVAAEHALVPETDDFTGLRVVNLATNALAALLPATGRNAFDDLAVVNGTASVTAVSAGQSVLLRFTVASGTSLGSTVLGPTGTWRLAALPSRNALALVDANGCRIRMFDTATGLLNLTLRVPLQIFPIAVTVAPGDQQVQVLNFLSNTVNLIDIATLLATTPSFTAEPPVTLAAYRQQMLDSFTDLGGIFVQYLKDSFCDRFLIECKECRPEDRVYLGTIDIQVTASGPRVHHICNFTKRHYAKTFRTWSYWLSALPLLPLLKRAFASLACLKLVP